jgi:hypothetical protein
MTLPCQPKVVIRLGTGPTFGDVLILGSLTEGILGTNVLGSTATTTVDVSSTVQRIAIRRGRDRIFEEYTPGTATIQFQDFTGVWNPENTSGPYYGKIVPMAQVQVSTNYLGTGYGLYTGFITSWDWSWRDQAADYALVTVQCVDAFRLFQLANITTVGGATAGELVGSRIDKILTEIGWPTQMRNIDAGATAVQADPGTTRQSLEAIQLLERTDLGAFFMDADGKATYYGRYELSEIASGTATVFRDDGTGIQYQQVDIDLDDTDLANQVSITREGGSTQTVTDATSTATYFQRSLAETGLMMTTDATALARATSILAYRKTPRLRVDSITLDLSSDSNRVLPGLSLDIADPVRVIRTVAGTSTLSLRITVNGISHDITPDRWITRLTTAYPLSFGFVLGSAEFGILGTSTL